MIYHLTTRADWQQAQNNGFYTAPSLNTEGFIHASTVEQILPVANAFYRDVIEPILLEIDTEKLIVDLKWEDPVHPNPEKAPSSHIPNLFPHIYGQLNLEAVVAIHDLSKNSDGDYELPASLVE